MLNVVLGKDLTLVLFVDYIVFTTIIHWFFNPNLNTMNMERFLLFFP
jgi:hypothetical protein